MSEFRNRIEENTSNYHAAFGQASGCMGIAGGAPTMLQRLIYPSKSKALTIE